MALFQAWESSTVSCNYSQNSVSAVTLFIDDFNAAEGGFKNILVHRGKADGLFLRDDTAYQVIRQRNLKAKAGS